VRIVGLEIDGFGVWQGLKLERISEGLNVLYGPNEAGKTTLLQFVRSILYGFSAQRHRYLHPVANGTPGGALDVASPNGQFHIERFFRDDADQVTLTAADGSRQGEHLIRVLLSDIDEPTYNNVFAVGLREMQELGSLSDIEAADLLYSLTAGLDRVSLVEVVRELENSRNRILDIKGGPCRITQLLGQRDKLRREIKELAKETRRYGRLAAERAHIDRETARLQEQCDEVEYRARAVELAVSLHQSWQRRAELDEQLAAMAPIPGMPDGIVERLDEVTQKIQERDHKIDQLRGKYGQLRKEARGLKVNTSLLRQAPRIEALLEQEIWITSLRKQIVELENETAEIKNTIGTEEKRLDMEAWRRSGSPALSERALAAMRPAASAMKKTKLRAMASREELASAEEEVEELSSRIQRTLAAEGEKDLNEAIDQTSSLVAELRRRIHLDERLEETTSYRDELIDRSRDLADRQMLPLPTLAILGAIFVFAAMLLLSGLTELIFPDKVPLSLGWPMVILGTLGILGAVIGKKVIERADVKRLAHYRKQIGMLKKQIGQTEQERQLLDTRLAEYDMPGADDAPPERLADAQRRLTIFEELVPLEARCGTARQNQHAAAGRLNRDEDEWAKAKRRWRQGLATAGLPDKLSPKQVRQWVEGADRIDQWQRQFDYRHEELTQRRRELEAFSQRVAQLTADCDVANGSGDPIEQLRMLAGTIAEEQSRLERHNALRRQARQLRRGRAKQAEAISRLKQRRRALFREAEVRDEDELRQRVLQLERKAVLQQEYESLCREISSAIGSSCPEEIVGEQINGGSVESLETRLDGLVQRHATLDDELKSRLEKRGQLSEQLRVLLEDRRYDQMQLELGIVETRLREVVGQWQARAVASRVLEDTRATYEHQRQPETLQEASGYLDRLTQGRYRRVWTPLGEDALRVDCAESGRSLPVDALSRGTREQLFLALRLAIVASYARRGARLPLVLDDVLVNFDAARAKAAAAVLRDFAAVGNQVLVFTCHEHILKLFKALKVTVSRLPSRSEALTGPLVLDAHAAGSGGNTAASSRKSKQKSESSLPSRDEFQEPENPQPKMQGINRRKDRQRGPKYFPPKTTNPSRRRCPTRLRTKPSTWKTRKIHLKISRRPPTTTVIRPMTRMRMCRTRRLCPKRKPTTILTMENTEITEKTSTVMRSPRTKMRRSTIGKSLLMMTSMTRRNTKTMMQPKRRDVSIAWRY